MAQRANWWRRLTHPGTELSPVVLQMAGLLMIGAAVVVWILGRDFNAALCGAGGSLLGIGEISSGISQVKELQRHIDRLATLNLPEPAESGEQK